MARPRDSIESRIHNIETFNPEHLRAARQLFTPVIRNRGRAYFDENRVIFDEFFPDGLYFIAEGSAGRSYTVVLRADGFDLAESTCNCPYNDYCKHIWAALLEAADQALPARDPESMASLSESVDWVSNLLKEPVRTIREPEKRYKIRFTLVISPYYGRNQELYIKPAMQYVKKSGDLGALSDFRESAVLEDLEPGERMLLDACLPNEGKRLSIHVALGYITGKSAIPFFREDSHGLSRITIIRPDFIQLDFKPKTNMEGIEFHPLLEFKGSEDFRSVLDSNSCIVNTQGAEKILFHPASATLVLLPVNDILEARILDLLVTAARPWFPRDIRSLMDQLPGRRIRRGNISTEVRINKQNPELILFIDMVSEGIRIRIKADTYESSSPEPRRLSDGTWEIDCPNRSSHYDTARNLVEELNGVILDTTSMLVESSFSDFLKTTAPDLLSRGYELRLGQTGMKIRRPSVFNIESSSGMDWFELKVTVDGQDFRYRDTGLADRVLYSGTDYVVLDEKQLEQLNRVAQIPRDSSGRARFHPNDIGSVQVLGSLIDDQTDPRLERTRQIISRLEAGFDSEKLPVSPLLSARLRDYQVVGLNWLRFLEYFNLGGILADDMGLGKTVQTIALLADALDRGETGPFLVVAPLSTVPNWVSEFHRFLPSINVRAHVGTDRGHLEEVPEGVVITTYQILQRDIDKISRIHWHLLCLDESQNIKNSATKTFKAVRSLSAIRTLALSGTPIENSVMELWSVMEVTNPGLLGPRDRYKRRYLNASKDGNTIRMSELRRRVAPFILRRTKDVVAADLPPKEEIIRTVKLSPGERRFYDQLKRELRDRVQSAFLGGLTDLSAANIVLTALLRLRQAAISPALLGEHPYSSSKIDEVL